jgi:TolB-like protein
MRYKDTNKSLREIAEELGVDVVVEGSVVQADGFVRITAQLIEASTDEHLWAQSFDRPQGDALRLEAEVATAIARRVGLTLTPAPARPLPAGLASNAGLQ